MKPVSFPPRFPVSLPPRSQPPMIFARQYTVRRANRILNRLAIDRER
jgi:hypothetical protein